MPKFFIFVIIFLLCINFYVYLHGRWALPAIAGIQGIYLGVFCCCALSFFAAMLLGNVSWQLSAVFGNIGGWWLLMSFYLVAVCLFTDLLRLINHFTDFYPAIVKNNYASAKLVYFGIVLLLLVVSTVVGHYNFSHPKIVTLNLATQQKQSSLDSLKIVAVSDIHLGDVVRKKQLQRYVALINAQQPDIIFIAGDLIDRNLNVVKQQRMDEDLRLLQAKYGCYAVLGNHDYHANTSEVLDFMRDAGITPLCDTNIAVDNNFIVAGRDDYSNKERKPLFAFIDSVSTLALPVILLDHQPVRLQEAVQNNVALQISGHTHNGQIFPFTYIVAKIYKVAYGYEKMGDTHFYTTSGLGLWGAPLRLGTQSEVVCIHLKFAQN
jgi:predicted MPP superfamily phosphohydrolase